MKILRFFNKFIFPLLMILFTWFYLGIVPGIIVALFFIAFWFWKKRKIFYISFATIQNGKHNFAKSAKWFEKAYKLDKTNFEAAANTAYMYLRSNNPQKAKSIIEVINPEGLVGETKIKVVTNIAIVLWKSGDLNSAIKMLEGLYNEGLESTSLYGNLPYFLLLNGDIERALMIAKQAYDYAKDDIPIIENLSRLLHLSGQMEEANNMFEIMISKKPTYPEAWYNLGLFNIDIKEYSKAKEAFEMALKCEFTFLSNISNEDINNELQKLATLTV